HRLDRDVILPEQGPRLLARARHEHTLYAHRTSRLRDGQRKVIASTTMIGKPSALLMHVMDTPSEASDNATSLVPLWPGRRPGRAGGARPAGSRRSGRRPARP